MPLCSFELDTATLIPVDEDGALAVLNMSTDQFRECSKKTLTEAMDKLGLTRKVSRAVRAVWRVVRNERSNARGLLKQVRHMIAVVEEEIEAEKVMRRSYECYRVQERNKGIKLRALLLAATTEEATRVKQQVSEKDREVREMTELIRETSNDLLANEKCLKVLKDQLRILEESY